RDVLGTRRDRAEDAPGERRVALGFQPRMEVVADLDEVEAHLFGSPRLPDQFLWPVRLSEQLVTDLHPGPPRRVCTCVRLYPGPRRPNRWRPATMTTRARRRAGPPRPRPS